jgi:hypothetical protein
MYLAILGGRVELRWKRLFRTLYVSMRRVVQRRCSDNGSIQRLKTACDAIHAGYTFWKWNSTH